MTENQSVMDQLGNDFLDDMKNNQEYLQRLRDQVQNVQIDDMTDEKTPISLFLLGPSRSGKSSLEHLITSSPIAKQGYESSVLDNAVFFTTNEAGIAEIDYLDELPAEYNDKF